MLWTVLGIFGLAAIALGPVRDTVFLGLVLRRPGGPAPVILGNLEHAPAPGPAVARDRGS